MIATTTTDSNGNYLFDDLPPGVHRVAIDPTTLPSGVSVVFDQDGTPDGTTTITLGAGVDVVDVDFGVAGANTSGSAGGSGLPNSGSEIGQILRLASVLFAAGWLLVGVRRRAAPKATAN